MVISCHYCLFFMACNQVFGLMDLKKNKTEGSLKNAEWAKWAGKKTRREEI